MTRLATWLLLALPATLAVALARPADRPPRKVAFIVGVAKYHHDFRDLTYAERDAEELAKTLKEGGFEVVVLTGSAAGKDRATRKNILARLTDLLNGGGDEDRKIRKGDLVLVALSGHGQQMFVPDHDRPGVKKDDPFFCPVDGKKNDPATLVSLSHVLDDLLAPCGSRNLVLVDACRDIADPNKGIKGIEGQDVALKGETAALFSCERGEQSYEDASVRHGVFTYAVLRGLRGAAARMGTVTWSSLVSQVEEEMASEAFKKMIPDGRHQTPVSPKGQLPRTVLLTVKNTDAAEPGDAGRPETKPPGDAGRTEVGRPALVDCTGKDGVSAAGMRKAQEAWAQYLGRQVEEEDEVAEGVKMKFVLVPPGKFLMGSPEDEKERYKDEAQHEVTITKPFYLARYTVTQSQYEALIGKSPSNFKGANLPVEEVSWVDADAFAKDWTKKAAGKLAYRLPTEAEWEYSCRGGRPSSQAFGIGDGTSLSSDQANFNGNCPYGGATKGEYREKTTPVGTFRANALGLYDMHGNVRQWCGDWYGEYGVNKKTDPTGPTEGSDRVRVIRGGGWFDYARGCRAAYRYGYEPGFRDFNLGFRLARVPSSSGK